VIADSAEPAGALIAQSLDLPFAVGVTGLPLFGEADVPPPFLSWKLRAGAIGRFRNRGGYWVSERLTRPIDDVLERYRADRGLARSGMQARVHVAQFPQALDYARTHLPPNFHYGSPWRARSTTSVELPEDGRPLVYCSLGTLQGSRRGLFAKMSAACATIGARAVIGHGGGLTSAQAAALPGDPLVGAFWPQESVLRRCSAAILHGGFNTTLDALAVGVPVLALPIGFEQPGTAARLKWTGAGDVASPSLVTVRRLSAKLARVMSDPGYRRMATALSAGMQAAGGAASAAARIDQAFG